MNYDWESLFHELSIRERINLIVTGLKCPEDSGEYKEAKYQLKRMASPLSAITAPFIILLLLIFLAGLQSISGGTTVPVTNIKPEEMKQELEKPIERPELKQETFEDIVQDITPTPAPDTSEAPPANNIDVDVSPKISKIVSPVHFPRLFESSGPKNIGKGIEEGGGTPQAEEAVMRALRWLKHVQESDGSWLQESGGGPGKGTPPAMTGLALLTFLAHGETPASDEFGETVEKAIKWLVNNQEASGHFKGRDNHDYSHPIATYALCEAAALTGIPMVRDAAEKAVKIIVNGQNLSGGWNYNCKQSNRDDTSYMGWCIQALKAAYIAKLDVPDLVSALDKSANGLKKNSNAAGGFGYTGPNPSNLTGVGVLCLQLLEQKDNPAIKQGIAWLSKATCDWDNPWGNDPLYYWYYVTQVKFRASKEIWEEWNPIFSTALVNNQSLLEEEDSNGKIMGYWKACSEKEHCKSYVYNTTLCTLMLEVYYRHLQTFQIEDHLMSDSSDFESEDGEIIIEYSKNEDKRQQDKKNDEILYL